MDNLRLLITDNSLLLTKKEKQILHQSFSSDEECFSLLSAALKPYKNESLDCFFSGSWLESQTRIVHYTNKDPFTADKSMLERLIENARVSFLEEYKEKELEVITTSVCTINVNGYQVTELKKDKATDLKITVFFAALPKVFKKKLVTALKPISENRITFASFAQSLTDRIFKLSGKDEFIACSAYERSTDIFLRKSGNFFEVLTIPLGTHHVLEHIAQGLSLQNDESESHLALYNDGALDPVLASKVEACILSFQISLDEEMKRALTLLSEGIALPSNVYLLVAPFFKKAYDASFRSDSYHSLSFSQKGFEVTNMSSILTS